MLNELIDSSAKCYHIIECNNNRNNMANDMNANESEDISISVSVRLNKHYINRDTTHVDNDQPISHSFKCSQSDRSVDTTVETIVEKCISFTIDIMKQKSKQILICLVLAIIVTLLAALHSG